MVYQVVRTHLSPYQSPDFTKSEKALLEGLGTSYRTLENFENTETILVTNTHTQLKNLPTDLLKNTKLIVHPNSGYDHFKNEHEIWKNKPLVVGHTIRAQAVAEYSLGALFEGLLELPQHMSWNKDRNWDRVLLKGTNVWVFGYGHIGKIIADTLSTIGMKVTVVDPFIYECPHHHLKDWRKGLIREAKVVIAAMSLNDTSKHFFNDEFFDGAHPELLFINGARGKLVKEESLRGFLLSHPKSFAFLDVFENEPFGDEWHGFPQVWKTSHIAGVEKNLDQKILEFEKEVISDFLKTSPEEFNKKYQKELLQNKWMKGVLI